MIAGMKVGRMTIVILNWGMNDYLFIANRLRNLFSDDVFNRGLKWLTE